MVKEKREITKEEFENARPFDLCCKFGYHPCGYDMCDEKKFIENGRYFFSWSHYSCCD